MAISPQKRMKDWRQRLEALRHSAGQALIEYVLIIVLVTLAIIVIITVAGPAVGNVFSNTVANLLNLTTTPEDPMSEEEFWALVTAVASYTPDTAILLTNTPAPVGDTDGDSIPNDTDKCPNHASSNNNDSDGDGLGDICDPDSTEYSVDDDQDGVLDNVDNCVGVANSDQADADSDGVGDACEGSVPPTNTPGPSPTPRDKTFPYPFNDDGNPDNWETDFSSVLKGPWNAEYWSNNTSGCSTGDSWNMTTTAAVTQQEQRLVFPRASHDSWTTLASRPHPSISTDFCARFTQKFNLPAGNYTWRYKIDGSSNPASDRLRIIVNGSVVAGLDEWDGSNGGGYVDVAWNVPSDGAYDLAVLYVDELGSAQLEVYLLNNGLQDVGECNWQSQTSDSAGSGGSVSIVGRAAGTRFWTDSPVNASNPSGLYQDSSFCILRLRGTINLAAAQYPYVEWWDQHSVDLATDTFWFAVRQAGTSTWYLKEIHTGKEDNYTWTRREVALSSFIGIDETTRAPAPEQNFAGKTIEVALIVESDSDGNRGYGWFIDDFAVKEQTFVHFPFPFADDMEGAVNWVGDGSWGVVGSPTRSGAKAWTDSPAGQYANNTNSSLKLNGLLDLTNASTVIQPELAFWHRWDVAANDKLFVEVSTNLGQTWQALRTSATDTTDYLYQAGVPNLSYKLETIPLYLDTVDGGGSQNFIGKKIMVRFRIQTDGSSTADGWYIDDVQFRNKPITGLIFPNWCDFINDTNSLSDWVTEGSWYIESAGGWIGGSGRGKTAYSGAKAFSDSPGDNYANGTNASLYLNRTVNLSGATNPILEFWQRWEIADTETLYVEMSEDDGNTWAPIWSFYYTDRPQNYSLAAYVSGDVWSEQISWQRVVIPLNGLLSAGNTDKEIKLRWRLDALNNPAVDDGWYIDNVCIREYDDPIISLPWQDDFEISTNNWYMGGDWATLADTPRSGAKNASDSPGTTYRPDSDSIMELRGVIDLTPFTAGTDQPTLYYWERYRTEVGDRAYAEVQLVTPTGTPLGDWTPVGRILDSRVNLAYNRRQINLSPYIGSYIRLRFRVQALNDTGEADGWFIDGVRLVEREGEEPLYTLPFSEDASGGTGSWVAEGDWSALTDSRSLGSGNVLGPGQWNVTYYTKPSGVSQPSGFPGGTSGYETLGTESVPEINFNWGSSAPFLVVANNDISKGANHWMASYRRVLLFDQNVVFNIHINSDDGHRLLIDGVVVSDQWMTCSDCRTGQHPSGSPGTVFQRTFDANRSYTLEIQYYDHTGNAKLIADFTLVQGGSTGVDPLGGQQWSAKYYKLCPGIKEPAWNETSPQSIGAIDFDWSSNPPSVVQTNNATGPLPGGSSTADPFIMLTNTVSIPAERYHESDAGTGATYSGASWQNADITGDNDTSMRVPDAGRASSQTTNPATSTYYTNAPELRYKVYFPAAGTYYLKIRAQGPTSNDNSVWVGLDDVVNTSSLGTSSDGTWGWTSSSNAKVLDVPSAGVHTVNLWMREDGTIVDHIFIADSSSTSGVIATNGCYTGSANELWVARFTRQVIVSDETTVTFNISSNDGHRFYVKKAGSGTFSLIADQWGTGNRTSSSTEVFPPGAHEVMIEYMAWLGSDGNRLNLDYVLQGLVFHSDSSKNGNTPDFYGASLILAGELNLPTGSTPGLTWWGRHDVGSNDTILVEVNTIGGYDPVPGAASTWTTVYSLSNNTNTNWRKYFVDLTSYAGQKIVVRFRMDAINNSDQRDGWYIDDIQVTD